MSLSTCSANTKHGNIQRLMRVSLPMRIITLAILVTSLLLDTAEAKCPPGEELCNLDSPKKQPEQVKPTPNPDMTLPVACFGEGVLHKSCNYFPAISKNGRYVLSIDAEGHALDNELFFRVLDTKTQKIRSHFLVFGFDGESDTKVPRKISVKTVGRRLKKVNRLIRRYQPEPMVDLVAAQGDLRATVVRESEYGPAVASVIHRGETVWAERYTNEESSLLLAFSPKHQILYVGWFESVIVGKDGYSIYRFARKSNKLNLLPETFMGTLDPIQIAGRGVRNRYCVPYFK